MLVSEFRLHHSALWRRLFRCFAVHGEPLPMWPLMGWPLATPPPSSDAVDISGIPQLPQLPQLRQSLASECERSCGAVACDLVLRSRVCVYVRVLLCTHTQLSTGTEDSFIIFVFSLQSCQEEAEFTLSPSHTSRNSFLGGKGGCCHDDVALVVSKHSLSLTHARNMFIFIPKASPSFDTTLSILTAPSASPPEARTRVHEARPSYFAGRGRNGAV